MINSFNRPFNRIRNEIIYGGHIISLDSPAFLLTIIILQDLPINIMGLIIAYLITLIVYSYNYQSELDTDILSDPQRVDFLGKRKKIYPILLCMDITLLIILSLMLFNYGFFIFALIILAGGILYTIVFKVLTRYIPIFKSIYSTAIWAYSGAFFWLFFYSLQLSYFYFFMLIFIFMRMFVNIAFFDIKDIDSDKEENLKTLPIIFGKKNAIKVLNAINLLSIILLIIFIYLNIIPFYAISLSLFFLYEYYYLKKSENADKKSLLTNTYVIADAEFIFWPIILILSKIIYLRFLI